MKDYAKINFYKRIYSETEDNQIYSIVKTKGEHSGFYELCSTYLDMPLNSRKFKDGSYLISETDIENAKNATKQYVEQHKIEDIHILLNAIYKYFKYAKRTGDERPTTATVWQEESSVMGRIGTFYNFCNIDSNLWSKLELEIVEYCKG